MIMFLSSVKTLTSILRIWNLFLRTSCLRIQLYSPENVDKQLHAVIEYLGSLISRLGIMTNPFKTLAIDTFPKPKTAKKVEQFFGMTSYYQKFVKDYAHIASPLKTLLKKDVKGDDNPHDY